MYVSIHQNQEVFKVAIVLLKKSNQNYNKLTENKIFKNNKSQVVCQPLLFFFKIGKDQIMK